MLNLERLRVLHAVFTTGSVVGAARALHVTTSAVSQQMARLEREVGQRLLERQGRGVRLTEAGDLLARHAGDLLSHVERIESGIAGHRGAVAGALAVAAFATAARGLLPAVLRDLRSRYPDLSVALSEREPHEAIPALARGDLDIAVVQDWADDALRIPDDLAWRHLLDDVLDVALPADHPLAGRAAVAVRELAGEDWISWSAGQMCHDWLVRTLRIDGVPPRVAHTASEHSTQLALVAAGLGAAVIPRLGRDPVPPSVRFVPVDPAPIRRVLALWRRSATGRPAVGAALDSLQRHCTPAADTGR
ncbi:LysR family transcriptional regulator [Dactylosporangium matsuzakiense]|uniref:LysR family transcriptional regulator n=1 Tax=Dactylosporangium matsuzakiense TaxID=53360 RepID=A0A9W6KDS2_9ACTN|nr:LysR family transcriptional regulator [Dactylosporangium matsuzakiense]UWZ47165.1 LysR family transcriptional regulator [Dactylosporangium matsuzakiense]GLK98400.1 LysR family transcriptional regulator [Dactylosporangium matsuzakiense]